MVTIMADEVARILGRLEQGFQNLNERFDRQDQDTIRREEKREQDKKEAIEERQRLHAENMARFQSIEEKATITYGMASAAKRWIEDTGQPMVDEWGTFKSKQKDDAAEERGSLKTWGIIGGIATAVGSAVGAILTYKDQLLDMLRGN